MHTISKAHMHYQNREGFRNVEITIYKVKE